MWSTSFPIHLKSSANLREHYFVRARRTAALRKLGYTLMMSANTPPPPPLPVVVRLVRIARRTLDDDNLAHAFKPIRDGIADAYKVKDNDPRIRWEYAQEKGKTSAIRIEIEPQ